MARNRSLCSARTRNVYLIRFTVVFCLFNYIYFKNDVRKVNNDDDYSSKATDWQGIEANATPTNAEPTIGPTIGPTSAPTIPGLCGALGSHSPLKLWMDHISDILAASQHHHYDKKFSLKTLVAYVLQLITPRLHLAQRAVPNNWKHIENVMSKLDARFSYLQSEGDGNSPPPPIKILVMGGSVTMGINCKSGIRFYDNNPCAWPAQLERLVNQAMHRFLGLENVSNDDKQYNLIHVHNAAVGGTNTAVGTKILKYHILSEPSYDIIINAYSTNDMHVNTMKEAQEAGLTIQQATFEMAQNFTRVALGRCTVPHGHTPLLIYLNDYLGNEQREILRTTDFSQSIQVLANYYGFGFVSYADTVRDLVYGTTQKNLFSPPGWYKDPASMSREVHPPFPMHLATSYIMTFYFLQMAHRACLFEGNSNNTWSKVSHWDGEPENVTIPGIPALRGNVRDWDQHPRRPPPGLLPRLNATLSLEHISKLWNDAEPVTCGRNAHRCPIAFLDQVVPGSTTEVANEYFAPYIQQQSGWSWDCDATCYRSPKRGFLPNVTSAQHQPTMVLVVPVDKGTELNVVTIFYLRSYGPKFANSTTRVDIAQDDDGQTASSTLYGTHDKRTSESYTEEIRLPKPATRTLKIDIKLVGGTAFKIQGIAVCS